MAEHTAPTTPLLVYFSSVSGNTARFVAKLAAHLPELRTQQLPTMPADPFVVVEEPYVLLTPTYGGGQGRGSEKGAVPKQVVKFLNHEANRRGIRGVIAAGNTNFGSAYCLAGEIISRKCNVPFLDRFELFGTSDDVARVARGIGASWAELSRPFIDTAQPEGRS
ncbi:class Ib ribonucleoside-diphosphate reductase assembly flavoprotein NrdI [Microbacterium sp. NPDC089696]|uniref:class Ib ribonucleoside-diphosphate reductase assembly flavoprotein NrdI n=1 Tax=Microbacterium sp. NPDC089696 TaxID=3364199 RepID=UPI0038292670